MLSFKAYNLIKEINKLQFVLDCVMLGMYIGNMWNEQTYKFKLRWNSNRGFPKENGISNRYFFFQNILISFKDDLFVHTIIQSKKDSKILYP